MNVVNAFSGSQREAASSPGSVFAILDLLVQDDTFASKLSMLNFLGSMTNEDVVKSYSEFSDLHYRLGDKDPLTWEQIFMANTLLRLPHSFDDFTQRYSAMKTGYLECLYGRLP